MADRLAHPFKHALSWWLIAEIARRHPDFLVREREDEFGLSNTLELARPSDAVHIYLNRMKKGSIHAVDANQRHADWPLETLVQKQAVEFVRMIEEAAGLPSPSHAPKTTPRTLTYRVAADIAMTTVHQRRYLSAHDTSWQPDNLDKFPLVRERDPDAVEAARQGARYWTLLEAKGSPVAILDTDGYAFTDTELFHLPTVYAGNGRSLHRTTATVFADLL